MRKTKKAQTWSMDALIAVSIFTVAFIFLFSFLSVKSQSERIEQLKQEGEAIPETLSTQNNVTFIEGQKINKEKLESFANMTYGQIKDALGITYDFCIHFEDEEGNIIKISDKTGIGSPKAAVGGEKCK